MRGILSACAVFCGCLTMQEAEAAVVIDIDLSSQTMHVRSESSSYDWRISTARSGYRTPRGTYRPYMLLRTHYSHKYHMSPMPYSIFFAGGYAIHGTYSTASLGRPPDKGINLISSTPSADGAVNSGEPAEAMSLDDDSAVLPFADAKALRETYLARMARLAYRERAGELLEAEAVEIKWRIYWGTVQASMLAVPSRTGRGIRISRRMMELDQEIRDGLAELGRGKKNGASNRARRRDTALSAGL